MIGIVSVLVALLPLVVFPFTLDLLEVNKQTVLLIGVCILSLAWLVRILRTRVLTIRYGKVFIFPALFVASLFFSSFLSSARYLSFVGESTEEYESALTALAGFVLLFLLVQVVRTAAQLRLVLFALFTSSLVAGLASLLQLLGIPVFAWVQQSSRVFNSVGSLSAAAAFFILTALVANTLLAFEKHRRYPLAQKGVVLTLSFVAFAHLVLLDMTILWAFLLVGCLIAMVVCMRPTRIFVLGSLFAFSFLFLPTPFPLALPSEVTPSSTASWQIATATLMAPDVSLLFGSGPGTFVFDYAKYHGSELNATPFWNVRFDRGYNYLFTLLATTGVLGILTFVLFFSSLLWKAARSRLSHEDSRFSIAHTLTLGFVLLFLLSFLMSFNMTLVVLLWFFAGLLVSTQQIHERHWSLSTSPRLSVVLAMILVLASLDTTTVLFASFERYAADSYYGRGVAKAAQQDTLLESTVQLNTAASLNRWSDLSYRALAYVLLERVQLLLAEGAGTAVDAASLQELMAGAIAASARAVELSPGNVANWETRGAVYETVSGVTDGADAFAIEAYETAHELEPVNPLHLTSFARAHHAYAKRLLPLAESMDRAQTSLRKAESALQAAIELKQDYAGAHYELALVYETAGRLAEAVAKMESVKRYNQNDVGVAFQLGVLYLRQGKNDLAQSEFERAIALVPTYANAHWYLASAYELNGDLEAAAREVTIVLSLQPNNVEVQARLARLQDGLALTTIPEPIEE